MEEQLISYNIAVLAKEKKFKEYCDVSYFKDNKIRMSHCYSIKGDECNPIDEKYAPTQSLLQKWLREVHGIFISIRNDNTNSWVYEIRSGYPEATYKGNTICSCSYGKYEDALEESLKISLNLI